MKKLSTSPIARRLYNPLLLTREIYVDRKWKLPEYKVIDELYQSAKKQTNYKNLVLGLEVDYSDIDQGFGGFWQSGYIPSFFSPNGIREELEKDFKFYWPKDHHDTTKFMSYLGSINLGIWPLIFHNLTTFDIDQWNQKYSFFGGKNLRDEYSLAYKKDYYLHLFVSEENDFETSVPDCHVRMTSHYNANRLENDVERRIFCREDEVPVHSKEEIDEYFKQWQEERTVKTYIKGPKKFFTNIRPRFYYDGGGYPQGREVMNPKGIFEYGEGDCHVYGEPHSQQEPKRYISPESYYPHGTTPMFSFHDAEADMTHQFYCDAFVMDDISHKRAYCKLDSSCT